MIESVPTPFITVAIPAHSRLTLLYEAIESCLKQDFEDFEILIGDSSPTDDIERIVASFGSPKIRYTRYTATSTNLPQKMNDFLKNGRGKWLVILGDDDAFEPGYLSAMAQMVRENPEAAIVRTRYSFMDTKGHFIRLAVDEPRRLSPADFLNVVFLPWYKCMVNITGVFFPRRKLQELGGFLETPQGWNTDTAAWAWLGAQGPCYFESRPLVRLRINTESDYKTNKLDPHVYLQTKRVFYDRITALFDWMRKTADAADLGKIGWAHHLFMKHWMRDEVRLYLDDYFMNYLRQDKIWVDQEVGSLLRTLKDTKMPVYLPLFFFYRFLSFLPEPGRKMVLRLFDSALRTRRKISPPERWTFFQKEKPHMARHMVPVFLFSVVAALMLLWYPGHGTLSFKQLKWRFTHPYTRFSGPQFSARRWSQRPTSLPL